MDQTNLDHILSADFTRDEFTRRRQCVAEAVGPNACALLQGAPRPASPHPEFAQSKVFDYLCGIRVERSYLLIDGGDAGTTLYIPADGISNVPGGALDEAARADICSRMGIDAVEPVERLASELESVSTVYILQRPDEVAFATKNGLLATADLRAADPYDGALRRDQLLAKNLRTRFPRIEIADLDPIVSRMRLIKSPAEVEILRKTGRMSATVCLESMIATRPGMPVSAYNGIADYVFRITGSCGHAYDFILESSHPESDVMLDGDLVLLDCAPDYRGYTMDIARMWPVNGAFDAWQRHTYGVILDYHKALINMAKPGNAVQDVYEEAARVMLDKYRGDAAGTAIVNNMIERGVRYYNHHVGLSAHDAVEGTWRDQPLQPGMVIAVDPMVWLTGVPHTYVRVEDTVVITETGCEVLTGSAPLEIEDIEACMKEPGRFPVDLTLAE